MDQLEWTAHRSTYPNAVPRYLQVARIRILWQAAETAADSNVPWFSAGQRVLPHL